MLAFAPDKTEALFETGAKWMKEVMGPDDMALLGLSQNPQTKQQVSDVQSLLAWLGAEITVRLSFS